MPTSTDVTKLNINELTESQYDAAVLGGVIGANDLSFLTDVNVETQVSTMPAASADELGKVYQFIGTTDANYTHGYFYECVSDGQQPATYSWSNVQVQAGGGGSSYTAGTGIDITSGVISVTNPTLQNTTTRSGSLGILGSVVGIDTYDTVVGSGSRAGTSGFSYTGITVVGANSTANNNRAIAIGHQATCSGQGSIAIGRCTVSSNNTIGLNATEGAALAALNDANSMYVAIKNGVWTKLLSSDETIPAARHASLPATDGTYVLKLVISGGVPTLSWVAE